LIPGHQFISFLKVMDAFWVNLSTNFVIFSLKSLARDFSFYYHLLNVNKVIEIEQMRYFDVDMLNDRGKKIISDVRELPFEYRGRMVVLRAIEVGLIDIAAKLIPEYVLKI
jgi:hypothetical protein